MLEVIEFGVVTFTCDECGHDLDVTDSGPDGTADFKVACAEIKEQGWRITKDGDEWMHYCPACKGKF